MAQLTLSQISGWKVSGSNYHDFVYDSEKTKATFENLSSKETKSLVYIGIADGIRLWTLPINSPLWPANKKDEMVHIPLYKSHVQKATRRKMHLNAIDGVLAMLYKDPLSILRRIGIIAIEDVCLVKGYSVIVWLMMAMKYISLTEQDVHNITNYVDNLCVIDNTFKNIPAAPITRKTIVKLKQYKITNESCDDILALWYRKRAGGMKGDMKMLENAIAYYYINPNDIQERIVMRRFQIHAVALKIPIIKEAIDFHPYPKILSLISDELNITSKIVKQYIWNVESGFNLRKPETIIESKKLEVHFMWKQIARVLAGIRKNILVKHGLYQLDG